MSKVRLIAIPRGLAEMARQVLQDRGFGRPATELEELLNKPLLEPTEVDNRMLAAYHGVMSDEANKSLPYRDVVKAAIAAAIEVKNASTK